MKKFIIFILSFTFLWIVSFIAFSQCPAATNVSVSEDEAGITNAYCDGIGFKFNTQGGNFWSVAINDVWYKDHNITYVGASNYPGDDGIITNCNFWKSIKIPLKKGTVIKCTVRQYCNYPSQFTDVFIFHTMTKSLCQGNSK